MKITDELVAYLAELSKIKLSDDQKVKVKRELCDILDHMDILNRLDTDNIEPLSHIFTVTNVMREDEVCSSYKREELLKNAPECTEETFVVPKTVD